MAPSRQKIATSTSSQKQQRAIQGFGRVTKVAPSSKLSKAGGKQAFAPSKVCQNVQVPLCAGNNRKRRRDDNSDENIQSSNSNRLVLNAVKKPKLQLVTPPPSQATSQDATPTTPISLKSLRLDNSTPRPTTPEELPASLKTCLSLHESFLKALSVHYAHNGPSAPAELTTLLTTMTCLYKKRRISKEDIQHILALYEISENTSTILSSAIQQKHSPFRLTSAGNQVHVEYVAGASSGLFDERCLRMLYNAEVQALHIRSRSDSAFSFLRGSLNDFPQLSICAGAQTVDRRQKAATRRDEILDLSSKRLSQGLRDPFAPSNNKKSNCPDSEIAPSVKSRTTSLFDRIKQKQLANTSTTKPTAEGILRRHAIGRIAEVVEILRMKQQQKMSSSFVSAIHASPSKVKTRVSFSLSQLVAEIKSSVAVPISDEEARICLRIVAEELPGFWVAMVELGNGQSRLTSVVLNGHGMSGKEAQRLLEEKES